MKVLYLSFVDISLPKGPSVNEREFIYSLSKLIGDKVHFVIPKPKYDISDELALEKITFIKNAEVQQVLNWYLQQQEAIKIINNLIKVRDYDLMIIRGGLLGFAIRKITKNNNLAYAMKTAGSGQFTIFKQKNILIKALYPLNQWIFKKIINDALVVDVVSTIQKKSLENITGAKGKIHFVDNGVNTDRFVIKDKSEVRDKLSLNYFEQIIGYVGGSPWERGGLQIIESLPGLLKIYPKLGGVIVGGGSKMDILFDKAKELGVEKNVVFVGEIPFDKVNDYISAFDIGISQLYKESQGASEQKVRQYLACGKPVIVSPGAVNNFIEEKNIGYIVKDPYNINEFSEKVDFILSSNKVNNEKFENDTRQYAISHLSVDSKVKQRLDLYKKHLIK